MGTRFKLFGKQETYCVHYYIQTEYPKHYRQVRRYRSDRQLLYHMAEARVTSKYGAVVKFVAISWSTRATALTEHYHT